MYQEWGFKETPFGTNPLLSNNSGEALLIGRNQDLLKIKRRISASSKIVTIEGANGIGKTSLINIASHQLYKEYVGNGKDYFFIPCNVSFQLTPSKTSEDFIDEVLLNIAQTLIAKGKELKKDGHVLNKYKEMDTWINAPQINTYNGNMSILTVGGGFGKTSENNTTPGFLRSGYRVRILDWLKEIFPYNQNGGVICTIDNMELLETCDTARRLLEEYRDTIFQYEGIRWILCIISGFASSPRLEGRLQDPIQIKGITSEYISEVFASRIKAYAIDLTTVYLPITSEEFNNLYKILNNNLRNTLSYTDNYCLSIIEKSQLPSSDAEKHDAFYEWLNDKSKCAINSVEGLFKKKSGKLFKDIIAKGGEFSLSDYALFGFNSLPAIRPHVVELEKYSLITCSIQDSDKRRKLIQISPKGYLINYTL